MDEQVETGQGALEPEVSGAIGPRTSSNDANADSHLADLETRLGERIQQEVERRFQSAKDKRWAQLERQYGVLSALAKDPEPSPAIKPAKGTSGELGSARRLISQAGLSRDPEAMELLRAYQSGAPGAGTRLVEGISQLALRRLSREPVKAGAVVQPGGGMAATDRNSVSPSRYIGTRTGDAVVDNAKNAGILY